MTEAPQTSDEGLEKLPPTFNILEATPDDVSEKELRALVGNLVLSTFNPKDSTIPLEKLKPAVTEFVENANPVSKIMDDVGEKIDDLFDVESSFDPLSVCDDSGMSFKEYLDSDLEAIMNYLNSGQLIVGRVNGKVVAMIGYRKGKNQMPDGRDIYEIKKASTLPGYGGRGYYKKLAGFVFDTIRGRHPESPILRVTATPGVKKYTRRLSGWRDCGAINSNSDVAKIYREGLSSEVIEHYAQEGYEVFCFDPIDDVSKVA